MRLFSLLLVISLLAGCQTRPVRDLTTTAETQNLTLEENRVWSAGKRFDELIAKQDILYKDSKLTTYVQNIADQLHPELKGTIRIQLIDSPDLNAFALPNGSVYFNIGMLARLDNEAQLATIVAHETSHFLRQHALKQRNSTNTLITAGMAITLLTGIPLSGELIAVSAISGYSQSMESEADQLGFERLIATGYDPSQAQVTFEYLLEEVETLEIDQPYFFSSHPRLEERIESFKQLTAEASKQDGIQNAKEYLDQTQQARTDMLQRYLELHRYKTLILMLDNDKHKWRYPIYAPYYLGEAYRLRGEEGDVLLAQRAYRQAIYAAPEFAPSYRALGILQMKKKQHQESLRNFRTYLTLDPKAKDRAYIEQYIKQMNSI